jgi:UDP-N-acetyl-D-mannosaminuronate dehydrogenase
MVYKLNIDEACESTALQIMGHAIYKVGKSSYDDPYIPTVKTPEINSLISIELKKDVLQNVLFVVLIANHNIFNTEIMTEYA